MIFAQVSAPEALQIHDMRMVHKEIYLHKQGNELGTIEVQLKIPNVIKEQNQ